jgi:hypothetical protein
VLEKVPYRKLLFSALNNLALLFQDTGDLRKSEDTYIQVGHPPSTPKPQHKKTDSSALVPQALKLSASGPEQSFCAKCHALQCRCVCCVLSRPWLG